MKWTRWLSILSAVTVIISCFFPWVEIESRNIFFGGFESTSNNYGKPGIFHSFLCGISIILLLVNKIWSVRTAFFITAINIAWAFRNFLLIAACSGGICPTRLPAIYVLLIASILTTLFIAFVKPFDMK